MPNRKRFYLSLIGVCCLFAAGAGTPASYSNNFEQTPPGKPPEEMLILNGAFTVAQIDGNRCLELAPDPLDSDGLLFGPAGIVTGAVSARIRAEATGRRFPEFGVGSNDAGGYKLILVPSQGTLELRRGDDAKASAACGWKSQAWMRFRLHVAKSADGKFRIEGKAWPDGAPEPQGWMVSVAADAPPPAGRASLWGMPYSGKPIRFDDLAVQSE
ncbi:MAG TPA: hypothetical protein VG326_20220 [Tepidisphaeraceae bacterium]|jgi:hypothetical protein|nr:hypothetical protein [Tepidisphaeraceae bacterium]